MSPVSEWTLVDCAGGAAGGAARYRSEIEAWLDRTSDHGVRLVGRGRRLSPRWLVLREADPLRARRIALNNVGFQVGAERVTLLRNALHFLNDDEYADYAPGRPRMFRTQIGVVRAAARRSDQLVVPCTAMAERVARVEPSLASRLVVRFHPFTAPESAPLPDRQSVLVPVLLAPYKRMDARLTALLTALDRFGGNVLMRVTATHDELPALANHPRVELLGRLDPGALAAEYARSTAVYYPTELESFGYPVAEARAAGRAVIALNTAQNNEIAAGALRGFSAGDEASLTEAVAAALSDPPPSPDPGAFDPDTYFTWLMGDR